MTSDLTGLLESMASLPYGGEAVDQLAHSLQAAAWAIDAGADDELVAAAALHDIGRAREVSRAYRGLPHERVGAAWCAQHFPERVAWLVGAHVDAKRFLVAVEPSYRDELSRASIKSLMAQGGPMTPPEAASFGAHRRHAMRRNYAAGMIWPKWWTRRYPPLTKSWPCWNACAVGPASEAH